MFDAGRLFGRALWINLVAFLCDSFVTDEPIRCRIFLQLILVSDRDKQTQEAVRLKKESSSIIFIFSGLNSGRDYKRDHENSWI